MKKRYAFLLLTLTLAISLFYGKQSLAAGSYSDEGTAFYAQTLSSGYTAEGIAFYAFDPNAAQPAGTVPVFRYFNSTSGDHFYTTNTTFDYSSYGYVKESNAFYAYDPNATQPAGTVPVYRFFNSGTSKHFYTALEDEKNSLLNNPQWGFAPEGIAFYANASKTGSEVPVYRFNNPTTNDHFYTASESEKNSIAQIPVYRFYSPTNGHHFYTALESEKNIISNTAQSGYVPEGIAFYAYNSQISGTSPVYRFYNSSSSDHFYTISEDEKNSLINSQSGYSFEGVAFYAFTTQTNGSSPVYRLFNQNNYDHFYTISASEKSGILIPTLGPDISVGLWGYSSKDIKKSAFQINANKDYNIRDDGGNIIAQVSGGSTTKVKYNGGNTLKIYNSVSTRKIGSSVTFDAADGDNTSIIFNTSRPGSSFDHYRGKIKMQYYHGPDVVGGNPGSTTTQVWVNNILPLEQYVWGMGETTGTGPMEHTKVMTNVFRTYGFWYIKYANKYAAYGFKIRSDSGSQIYWGYDWETKYSNIKTAAQATRGIIASYGGDVALTPFSSWSAGQTRSAQDAWGSSAYPWCQSRKDDYGNYNDSYFGNSSTKSQSDLISAGNHMVGLIAHGSLHMANNGSSWQDILNYYYKGLSFPVNY
ncbi:MAG TPA: SpoIID/LytB domain-containing protein [Patescibacteria group bacterium]